MSLHVFCFSPAGSTRRVAEAAAAAWGGQPVWHDLGRTAVRAGMKVQPQDECIIAVPCFSGRVPPVIAERIASLRGNGARTLTMVTFGNRGYEDSLLELTDLASAAGFQAAGAAAIVARHSLAPRIASGRPSAGDLSAVAEFARRARASRGSTVRPEGHRPYRPYSRLGCAPVSGAGCTSCKICADACPTGAIRRSAGAPADISKCMGCMSCIQVCPRQSRSLPQEFQRQIAARLAQTAAGRARSAFFLAE